MSIIESIRIALKALIANKLRSILTMLGVIIGVASVITLVSVGQGVKVYINSQIEALGTNLIIILPGQQKGVTGGTVGGAVSTLTVKDAEALQKESDAIGRVAPILEAGGQAAFEGITANTLINGTNSSYAVIRNHPVAQGRFISVNDVQDKKEIVVLGVTVKNRLFGDANPIGEKVRINETDFEVVGVLERKGRALTIDNDDRIFIPITTSQDLLGTEQISMIFAQAINSNQVSNAVSDSKRIIERLHGKRDFSVSEQQDILSAFEGITRTLTGMLAAIAGVSLVVGGIGIMNIMLVSVTERTREIGVRKAVGARDRDILYQFLIESIVLSIVGGLLGVVTGLLGAQLLDNIIPYLSTSVTVESIVVALAFATLVGLFFGIYPAQRAARLNPIEALRYE